jgi:hypothetical protein
VVRQSTQAPVILFRRTPREIDEGKFDKVFHPGVAPWVWLGETAALIARSQALRQESSALRAETAITREETHRQRERARRLCKEPSIPREPEE